MDCSKLVQIILWSFLPVVLGVGPGSAFGESSEETLSPLERHIEWREIHRSQRPVTLYLINEFKRLRLQFADISGDIALIAEQASNLKPADTTSVQSKIISVKAAISLAESESDQVLKSSVIVLLLPLLILAILAILVFRPWIFRLKP